MEDKKRPYLDGNEARNGDGEVFAIKVDDKWYEPNGIDPYKTKKGCQSPWLIGKDFHANQKSH